MPDKILNLQDQFLNQLRRHKVPVTLFLMKGVKLQGVVTWFDNFSLLLRRDGQSQLVYKHSISTVVPMGPVPDLHLGAVPPRGTPQLQDLFLSAAHGGGAGLTIFLVNGVMLQGALAGFDAFSLALERHGQVQLVYKHAISTLQPDGPLDLGSADGTGDGDDH